uniref:Protein kinase domain-containing protein n=1 Tax=Oryzias latipes TaxID=8090 RepID=A0A3P9K1T9_ORYLA
NISRKKKIMDACLTPLTQSPPTSAPPPPESPPPAPTKPLSVPTYTPVSTATARVAPTPITFSPQMVQTSSLTPVAEGASTPSRDTPSGRSTPSTTLHEKFTDDIQETSPLNMFCVLTIRGRYGVVRECRENATGKMYMAKIIPYTQENKKDVLKEYEILKSLHSDKIMALHEAYVTPRYLVLVAEYCTGKELLYTLIDRFVMLKSCQPYTSYLVQILQAVEYLHNRRVLHLDLKPDNIIVTNLNVVKVVDFGSAQSFNPLTPETLKREVVGPPADMWTVGVVTYIIKVVALRAPPSTRCYSAPTRAHPALQPLAPQPKSLLLSESLWGWILQKQVTFCLFWKLFGNFLEASNSEQTVNGNSKGTMQGVLFVFFLSIAFYT